MIKFAVHIRHRAKQTAVIAYETDRDLEREKWFYGHGVIVAQNIHVLERALNLAITLSDYGWQYGYCGVYFTWTLPIEDDLKILFMSKMVEGTIIARRNGFTYRYTIPNYGTGSILIGWEFNVRPLISEIKS